MLERYSFIHSFDFIHSGHFYSAPSSPLLLRGAPDYGYCIGVSRRSAQATAGKGLAQGPYVAARAGVKPTTLRLKVINSIKAPPTSHYLYSVSSRHYYSDALPAQSRPKKKDLREM